MSDEPDPAQLAAEIPQLLKLDNALRGWFLALMTPLAAAAGLIGWALTTGPWSGDGAAGAFVLLLFVAMMGAASLGRSALSRWALGACYGLSLVGATMLLVQDLRSLRQEPELFGLAIAGMVLAAIGLTANFALARICAQLKRSGWPAELQLLTGRLRGRRKLMTELKRWQASLTPATWEAMEAAQPNAGKPADGHAG